VTGAGTGIAIITLANGGPTNTPNSYSMLQIWQLACSGACLSTTEG